jgi:Family of unknown function (DUF6059)
MGGTLGGRAAKARGRAVRVLAAGGALLIALLAEVNCLWAPDLYGQMLLERRRQCGELPPGHPEVLRPEVPPSPAEIDLWSRLGPDWTRTDGYQG